MTATRVSDALPSWVVEASSSERDGGRVWTAVAAAAVIVALVVNVVVAWSAVAPSFPFDEVSPLQMSRMLAGLEVPAVRGAGYNPGWSVVLAPVWWFTSDPGVMYRVAIWIGVAVAMITIWPLSRFVAELGLSVTQSVTVAAVVMTMPSRALQSDYALSEKLLFLLVVCSFLVAWRLWERPSWWRAVLFSVLIAAVLFTHVRMAPLVAAAVIWLALFALRNWRVALVGLASLIPLAGFAYWAGSQLNVILLGGFGQAQEAFIGLFDSRPSLFARVALGQAWNQTVGSLGMIAVGVVALAIMTWRELRRFRVGRAGWLLAGTLAMFLLSVMSWANEWDLYFTNWRRLDAWIYGRYIEPVTALVVAVGLAVVVRGLRLRPGLVALALTGLLVAPVVLWVAPTAPTWGYVTPAHIAGVLPWYQTLPGQEFPEFAWILPTLTNENRFWLIASLSALVVLAVVVILRRRPVLVAGLLSVLFAAGSLVANVRSDQFQRQEGEVGQVVAAIDAIEARYGPVRIGYDRGCWRPGFNTAVGQNYNGFWLLPTVISEVDRLRQTPEQMNVDLIISCDDGWITGRDAGALRYNAASTRWSVIWVMPGPVQDGLARERLVD